MISNILNKIEENEINIRKYKLGKEYKLKRFIYCLLKEGPTTVIPRYYNNIKKVRKLKKMEKNYRVINPKCQSVTDKKIVIYSCITGNYDIINEPLYHSKNVDFILFTDQNIKSENWTIKKIPNKILKLNNNILINRYIKMHPFEMFKNSNYDYAIYIDGNVKILTDLSGFTKLINNTTGLAMFRHHSRNCIYIEEKACNLQKLGNKKEMRYQLNRYEEEGYPKNNGLIECTIFTVDLKNKNAEKILLLWWEEFKKSKSMRDQLSLPYILWKQNLTIYDVGYLGNNLRMCPKFRINVHKNKI